MPRKIYANLNNVSTLKTLKELQKWRKERKAKRKDLSYTVPVCDQRKIDWLHGNRSAVSVTWIGHSSFLLQKGGLNIVTDPVWAGRMGLEKRLAPPGIAMDELPPIDVILLSHSHYDHMDIPSLKKLKRRSLAEPLLLVPAGLAGSLRKKGFTKVEELEWWEYRRIGDVEFHFVPAQHWTRRTLWDTNRSHWGGWVLRRDVRNAGSCDGRSSTEKDSGGSGGEAGFIPECPTVYFAGDSGYFPGFRMIGERFRPDYVLMPIGAYEPEWFMSKQHVSPEEAVQAFLDTSGAIMIPMHYGAFRLADDTPKEALDRLYAEWERRGLPWERLKVLTLGETLY